MSAPNRIWFKNVQSTNASRSLCPARSDSLSATLSLCPLFSRACLNCSHPAGLYCGITNKIAWMTPKVRRARLQAKVASLFYSPKMKALVHMLYSPLPPNYRSFHLSFRVSQLEILSIHKMQVFPSSRCFLSFTTSAELKSYCTQN